MKTNRILNSLFCLYVYIQSCQIYSQEGFKVIPPTPEASALGQYGSIPMGSYTGSANFSIPLYTVKGKFLEVPVSLNYNSNGIMVEDIAPWTGYGWTLNGSGIINRTVLDLPDETRGFEALPNIQIDLLNQENCQKIEDDLYDLQYDEFQFSFMGNSGKFIIVDNQATIIEALDDYKIEISTQNYTPTKIIEFKITDKNGIQYYFGKSYGSYPDPQETAIINDHPTPITSWHLTKIKHWSGEQINFEYSIDNQSVYFKDYGQTETKIAQADVLCYTCPIPIAHQTPIYQDHYTKYKPTVFHLSKISSTNSYNYDYIIIDRNLKLITGRDKKIKLDTYGSSSRYFLTDIEFKSKTDLLQSKYSFEYNSMNDFIAIPRTSKSKDWWGYYNGQNNTGVNKGYLRGNHEPYPDYAVYGMLKKITYPTGGVSTIEYEGHSKQVVVPPSADCINFTEYRINLCNGEDTINPQAQGGLCDGESFLITGINGAYVTFTLHGEYTTESPNINGTNVGYAYFTLFGPNGAVTPLDSYMISGNINEEKILLLPPGNYTLSLSVRSSIYRASFNAKVCSENTPTIQTKYFGGVRVKQTTSFGMDAPHNEIRTKYDYNNSGNFLAPNQITYIYNTVACDGGGGGYDYWTHCDNTIRNSIGYFNSLRSSEGTAFYYNVSEFRINKDGQKIDEISHFYNSAPVVDFAHKFLNFAELPSFNPIRFYGTAHEYKTEYFKYINNTNKKIVKRETLVFENDFNLNGTNHYSYLREIKINSGEIVGFVPPENYAQYYPSDKLFQLGQQMNLGKYEVKCFWRKLKSKETTLFFYDGFNNETRLEEKSKYLYTNIETIHGNHIPRHHQVISEIKTNSKQDKNIRTVIDYKYPDDSNNGINGGPLDQYQQIALNGLKRNALHRVGTPYQTDIKLEEGNQNDMTDVFTVTQSTKLSSQRTTYKEWGENIILPEFIKYHKGSFLPNQTFENKINFLRYSLDSGKVIEAKKENDITICYLYDHDKRNIIATIENATYIQIANQLGISVSDLDNIAPIGFSSIPAIENLRNTLTNAMITTYAYNNNDQISAITDPKGSKTTYHYNIFNQLIYIRDENGNILKEFEYHLKNQN